jgi:rhomboid-like protein
MLSRLLARPAPQYRLLSTHSKAKVLSTKPNYLKHVFFAVGFTVTAYTGAAVYDALDQNNNKQQSGGKPRIRQPEFSPAPGSVGLTHKDGSRGSLLKKDIFTRENLVIGGIILTNIAVHCLWRVPRFHVFLDKYFSTNIYNNRVAQHVFTMFSHESPMHLAFNMFVLYSFSSSLMPVLGGPAGFLATYLSMGVCSSVNAHLLR